MKVLLLTFPFSYSHGSILQSYALYRRLKQEGHDVTVLNRQWPPLAMTQIVKRCVKNLINRLKGVYHGEIFSTERVSPFITQRLNTFVNTEFGEDLLVISDPQQFKSIDFNQYHAVIVGSDQTWRPKYVPCVEDFYLGFVPKDSKCKRISYAPSFGTDDNEYSNELRIICKELINRFTAVSVREQGGVALCKQLFDVSATIVLDPTMLFDAKFYSSLILQEQQQRTIRQPLIATYILDKNESKRHIVEQIATQTGMEVIEVNGATEDYNAPIKSRIAPSISQWLHGFDVAKFIIVDSFHAMVFAILFNKPFVVLANRRRGLSRFESLLSLLGLQERLIDVEHEDINPLSLSEINWSMVNNIIDEMRMYSFAFLDNALN